MRREVDVRRGVEIGCFSCCWYEPKANDPMAEIDAECIAREFLRLESLVVERT